MDEQGPEPTMTARARAAWFGWLPSSRPLGGQARDLLVHLRLHFQLLLAPIFLWGFLLADGTPDHRAVLAFGIVHALLYGGATAFNSAYDRDEGPVGGLERPPPVSRALLPFSVGVLLLGLALSPLVGLSFTAIYAGILVLAVAYSHPRPRWKASPWPSLGTIFFGQGVLGFFGGWAATGTPLEAALQRDGVLGAITASLVVAGFYPLTQLFQIEEDAARGDRTLAVAWGPERCFQLAGLAFGASGVGVAVLLGLRYGLLDALLAGGFFTALIAAVESWRRGFEADAIRTNFRTAARLNSLAALGLGVYAVWRLLAQ